MGHRHSPHQPRWWAASALLIAWLAMWAMDHLTDPMAPAIATATPASAAPKHEGRARLFLLLVDSLRFETAIDRARMPYLSALRRRSTHARVRSSREAVTVSAVREMFTGRSRARIGDSIRSFAVGHDHAESLFTQLRTTNVPFTIAPQGSFQQFGRDVPPRADPVSGMAPADQDARVRAALGDYLAGELDVVVMHLDYTDKIAHAYGTQHPAYRTAFAAVDDLIRELDEAIPPQETLVVAGDHGHTEAGAHALGLDVPTFAAYRGAAFARGADLGTIPIAEHRYLMSWALELPLSARYRTARHPKALIGGVGRRPVAFSSPAPLLPRAVEAAQLHQQSWVWWLVVLHLGVLAGLWLAVVGGWLRGDRQTAMGFAATALGLATVAWTPYLLTVSWLAGVAAAVRRSRGRQAALIPLALGVGGAVGLHLWGQLLAEMRAWIHEPTWQQISRTAVVVIIVAAVISWRLGSAAGGWAAMATVALLGFPTVYRYGAVSAMTSIWLAWVAAVLVSTRRWGPALGHPGVARPWPRAVTLAAGIWLLLQTFGFADASNFQHVGWATWIRELAPSGDNEWLAVGLLAKASLFVRWRVPPWTRPLGVIAVYVLTALERGAAALTAIHSAALVALLVATAVYLGRTRTDRAGAEARRVALMLALFVAHFVFVGPTSRRPIELEMMLAALVLSAWLVRVCLPASRRGHHHTLLTLLGVLVAGWTSLRWTLRDVAWHPLAEDLQISLPAHQWPALLPLLIIKHLIVVLMVRVLLRELFAAPHPRRAVVTAWGVKLLSATLVVTGIGQLMPDTYVYLEAWQEIGILLWLGVALL